MKISHIFLTIIFVLGFGSNGSVFSNNPKLQAEINKVRQQLCNHFTNLDQATDTAIINYLKKIGTPAAKKFLEAGNYYEKGLKFMTKENYAEAIKSFNVSIDIDSNNAFSWDRRGTSYFSIGNYNQSINDYTKAINLAPNFGFYYTERALAYMGIGNIVAMINDIRTAASLGEPKAQKIIIANNNFNVAPSEDMLNDITNRFAGPSEASKAAFKSQMAAHWKKWDCK